MTLERIAVRASPYDKHTPCNQTRHALVSANRGSLQCKGHVGAGPHSVPTHPRHPAACVAVTPADCSVQFLLTHRHMQMHVASHVGWACGCVWVCRCASVWVCGCVSGWMFGCGCADVDVCVSVEVCGCLFNLDRQDCLCAWAAAFTFLTFIMLEVWYNLDLIWTQ